MRATRIAQVVSAFIGVVLMSAPLAAHHSFAAEFDESKPVTVKGTITRMDWVNPHSWLYIDVKAPDGTVQSWALEFGSPNQLYRRGWKKESLPVGAEVTVTGWLSRTEASKANAKDVILQDGKKLFAGSAGTGAPGEK
jgi:hypothetical protein